MRLQHRCILVKFRGIFKITYFQERLQTEASIGFYFCAITTKQSGFCTTYSFQILGPERRYKNNLQDREFLKKIKFYDAHILLYIMLM